MYSDCSTILISSGLSRFCLKIPNPDQYAIGIGKIPISTRVVIFPSNSEENTKVAIKLPKNFYRNCCVKTPEMVFSEPLDLKISWGGGGGSMPPEPP